MMCNRSVYIDDQKYIRVSEIKCDEVFVELSQIAEMIYDDKSMIIAANEENVKIFDLENKKELEYLQHIYDRNRKEETEHGKREQRERTNQRNRNLSSGKYSKYGIPEDPDESMRLVSSLMGAPYNTARKAKKNQPHNTDGMSI